MTTEEFSNEFDVLLKSYKTDVEFDEYEKSIYLTRAQEEIVKSLYNGTLADGFDSTEEVRRSLNNLIIIATPVVHQVFDTSGIDGKYEAIITDVWVLLHEHTILKDTSFCNGKKYAEVVPVRIDEYNRIKDNPFRGATDTRVLRLDAGLDNNFPVVNLISKYKIDTYYIEYLKRPEPIILVDLPSNLTIDTKSVAATCQLAESLHRIILERAVALAVASESKK